MAAWRALTMTIPLDYYHLHRSKSPNPARKKYLALAWKAVAVHPPCTAGMSMPPHKQVQMHHQPATKRTPATLDLGTPAAAMAAPLAAAPAPTPMLPCSCYLLHMCSPMCPMCSMQLLPPHHAAPVHRGPRYTTRAPTSPNHPTLTAMSMIPLTRSWRAWGAREGTGGLPTPAAAPPAPPHALAAGSPPCCLSCAATPPPASAQQPLTSPFEQLGLRGGSRQLDQQAQKPSLTV
mmetsp:Transcript_25490/g.55432  ORF Transcript_25490/g.55432 Transcript_25490/m.55432 type:complete len:234 (-) Transcript_25490:350-1051(-)